jgi:hypothetical protein
MVIWFYSNPAAPVYPNEEAGTKNETVIQMKPDLGNGFDISEWRIFESLVASKSELLFMYETKKISGK